jgi:hypothetical protein
MSLMAGQSCFPIMGKSSTTFIERICDEDSGGTSRPAKRPTRNEATSRAAQYGWTWPQAKLGYPAGWELRQKYAAYDLPSIWLIGPDGKVIARDLKDGAIEETVTRVLRDK